MFLGGCANFTVLCFFKSKILLFLWREISKLKSKKMYVLGICFFCFVMDLIVGLNEKGWINSRLSGYVVLRQAGG